MSFLLRQRLASAKTRLRGAPEIDLQIKLIVDKHHVGRYLQVRRVVREEHVFKQARRGRPGPDTAYRKITKRRFDVEWNTNENAIAYDRRSDGMYPLMTNDRKLTAAQVLEVHKGQPMIEKRFEQIKTVHEIAPVFLKDEGRIEALFTLYAIALLVQALIECELRRAMARQGINELPIYPEQRECAHPTTEQVLRLFSLAQRRHLLQHGQTAQVSDQPPLDHRPRVGERIHPSLPPVFRRGLLAMRWPCFPVLPRRRQARDEVCNAGVPATPSELTPWAAMSLSVCWASRISCNSRTGSRLMN